MGGICGIVQDSRDGRIDPKLLSPMIAQLNKGTQGPSSVNNWGTMCLGVCHAQTFLAGTADIRVHGKTVGLGLYGNIYNLKELGINDDLLRGMAAMGITKPTPIQVQAIPAAIDGKDLIAGAQTGTGKTAAFLLPLIDVVFNYRPKVEGSIRGLVIVPTRELARQVLKQIDVQQKILMVLELNDDPAA